MFNNAIAKLKVMFNHEAAGGVVLGLSAIAAMVFANTWLSGLYDRFLSTVIEVRIDTLAIEKPLLLWVNDGLMAVFFFLVGLEIKRELMDGHLSSWRQSSLPVIAAVGGMVFPAAIYLLIAMGDTTALSGWAIPSATDIAFAMGVIALFGKRVPVALKVFLLALAIIDDLGAIIIIALFYTSQLSTSVLALAALGFLVLVLFNRMGVLRTAPYIIVGTFIWVCVLKSGIHATLAGVLVALTIPLKSRNEYGQSPLLHLEHALVPYVGFFVMPLFAFANAGVPLWNLSPEDILSPVPLGIAAGLLLGKPLGILLSSFLAVRFGISRLPEGVNWGQLGGVSCLAGIGFTMSLFIGTLAFNSPEYTNAVRIGVLMGSIASGIIGSLLLNAMLKRPPVKATALHKHGHEREAA